MILKLEIAGLTIGYRNAVDLTEKVRTTAQKFKSQRTMLEQQAKELRIKERELERFLGVSEPAMSETRTEDTTHA